MEGKGVEGERKKGRQGKLVYVNLEALSVISVG